jgi:hypothetical protein
MFPNAYATTRTTSARRATYLAIAALLVLVAAGVAFAAPDTVRVKTGPAPIRERERASSAVLMTVPVGTVLEVLKRDEGWYWVMLPADANGIRRAGYIEAYLVEATPPDARGTRAPTSGLAPPRAAARGRTAAAPAIRFLFRVNGGYQPLTTRYSDSVVKAIYSEQATITSTYTTPRGAFLDFGGGVVLVRNLSLSLGVTRFNHRGQATVAGDIPHPFFFNRPRHIQGNVVDLNRYELGAHLELGWRVPLTKRFDLTLFGGPSVFRVQQDLTAGIQFSEAYPYDTAVFTGVDRTRATRSVLGYNVGGDLVVPLWRFVGVGAGVRFTRADAGLSSPGGHVLKVRAGGAQAFAGLRIRF